uniref:Uncharacterized protein n=1 Tax=Avena sativa TaxID=4498 RepID=A0ACD5W7K8_AVESA
MSTPHDESAPSSESCCYLRTKEEACWWLKFSGVVITLALVAAAVVVGMAFSVIHDVKASVEDARLDTFALYTANRRAGFFAGNISVAVAVRNPNWAMSIEYRKPLVADLVFFQRRLYKVTVVEDGQKQRRSRTRLHLLHAAWEVPSQVLDTAALEELEKQNATGVFDLEMRLYGELKFLAHRKPRRVHLSCPLRLQVAPPGHEVVVFPPVECVPFTPENIYF